MDNAETTAKKRSFFSIDLKESVRWRNILTMIAVMLLLQVTFQLWSIILPRYLMEIAGLSRQHLGKATGSMGVTYDIIRILFVGVFGAL